MRLTSSVSYAISILLNLATYQPGQLVTAARIAKGGKFPPRFLYRVLRRLVDAGLIAGVSGPGGGYRLAKKPPQISLLDVVNAIEGAPAASQLTPMSRKHRGAIAKVNQTSTRIAEQANRELRKLKLSHMLRAGQ